jgi:hypothetical protein
MQQSPLSTTGDSNAPGPKSARLSGHFAAYIARRKATTLQTRASAAIASAIAFFGFVTKQPNGCAHKQFAGGTNRDFHLRQAALNALRVRPDILRGARESYNSAQHEPDHRKNDKTDVVAGEVLVVFS